MNAARNAAALERVEAARGQPAGRRDLAAHRDRVVVAGAAARRCRRASARPARRPATPGARGARRRRSAPRRRARRTREAQDIRPMATSTSDVVEHDQRAQLARTARHGLVGPPPRCTGRPLHDGALAHLARARRDEAVDGLAGRPRAAPRSACRRGSTRPLLPVAAAPMLARDLVELRGLVARGRPRSARRATSALSASASPPSSSTSAARAARAGSAQSTGSPHPRASARCHVAGADQTDSYGGPVYSSRPADRASSSG